MTGLWGVLLALTALASWGFGYFFIQKSTRIIGVWKSLFYNDLIAVAIITPFVYKDLKFLTASNIILFLTLAGIGIFASLFDFTALKQGKISIIEPLLGIELPITIGLSLAFAGEYLTPPQMLLIGAIFIGIILAITTHHKHLYYHKRIFEKGVLLAGLGAIATAFINFLVGISSQNSSPLMTIWFFNVIPAIICGVYLGFRGELKDIRKDFQNHFVVIVKQSVIDNLAWVAFAFSVTFIPIAIATAISGSYIALAALLGVFMNHELLKKHQLIGVALVIIGVIILSFT